MWRSTQVISACAVCTCRCKSEHDKHLLTDLLLPEPHGLVDGCSGKNACMDALARPSCLSCWMTVMLTAC